MTAIVHAEGLTRRFGWTRAVEEASFTVAEHAICALLGRNGAGKTTLLRLITASLRPTAGTVRVFGASPWENSAVLAQVCSVHESQIYPAGWTARQAITAASWFYPTWDAALAHNLIDRFDLPAARKITKLSRGQYSAVGAIIGLASRAPLTLFDEPYLGLDAIARRVFYDALLEDYAAHPRTVIVSTHLIDEIAHLLSHVLVIDRGRILMDTDAASLHGGAVSVSGAADAVAQFTRDLPVVRTHQIGTLAQATLITALDDAARQAAANLGLDVDPVSLQQLVVDTTLAHAGAGAADGWGGGTARWEAEGTVGQVDTERNAGVGAAGAQWEEER
jgi:ABC-2 type transport system ATP-binding protein